MSNKLVYFPARGRAEAIRVACALGGIEIEDLRYPGEQIYAKKASGELAPPFNQFPFWMDANGQSLAQSGAILRYVAKKAGLVPSDDFEAAVMDSISEQCNDVASAIYNIVYFGTKSKEERAVELEKFTTERLPNMLAGVVKYLGDRDSFSSSLPVTVADISVFCLVQMGVQMNADVTGVAPELKRVEEAVLKNAKLADYFVKRAEVEAATA